MFRLWALIRGGFLKDHRAEILGIAAGIGGLANALAQWAVGDVSIVSLIRALSQNWDLIAGVSASPRLGRSSSGQEPAPTKRARRSPRSPTALRR